MSEKVTEVSAEEIRELKKLSPLSILEKYLWRWPPLDARLHKMYQVTHDVIYTDDPLMVTMMKNSELKLISKIPASNTITVGLYVPVNMTEIMSHKINSEKKRSAWEAQGSPEDIFNPSTGDLYSIATPWWSESPKPNLTLYVSLRVSLDVMPDRYVLSCSAHDTENKVLYYNITEDPRDPTYLIKRMIHEVFGNQELKGDKGRFLDGIKDLIQGKKLNYCKNYKKPYWVKDAQFKTYDVKLIHNTISKAIIYLIHICLTVLIPIIAFGYIGYVSWQSLMLFHNKDYGDPDYLNKLIGSVIVIFLSIILSKVTHRQIEDLKTKSKII